MSERFLFFNSTTGDARKYQAQDFAEYFGSVLSSGLLHTDEVPGMSVAVEPSTLNTVVSVGKAIMKGHLYELTAPLTLAHGLPETSLNRIDRVVLRLNLNNAVRDIKLHVIAGAPSGVPVAPELTRNDFIYEVSLAQVLVRQNTVQLLPSDLVDERLDESLCGLVHSLISIPTDQFQSQWDSFFNATANEWDNWFSQQQGASFIPGSEKGAVGGVAKQDDFTTHLAEDASLITKGHVKLSDSVTSSSTTLAATSNSVKKAYDLALSADKDLFINRFDTPGNHTWVVPQGVTKVYVSGTGGGGGGASSGKNGTSGGVTSFGNLLSLSGGGGGAWANGAAGGSAGGAGGSAGNPREFAIGGGGIFSSGGSPNGGHGDGYGGGGGGYSGSSGGGAAAVIDKEIDVVEGSTINITIGDGGIGGNVGFPYPGGNGASGFILIKYIK